MQNSTDACRTTASGYPGGLATLAVRLGVSAGVLSKELNSSAGFKLGVERACLISQLCIEAGGPHCYDYVNAVASNCGGFVELPVRDMAPGNIHGDSAGLVKECADVVQSIAAAMADGSMSPNDRKCVEKEARELIGQLQRVLADVDAEAARGPNLRRV